MNIRQKVVATIFLIITSALLCADILFNRSEVSYFSHIVHSFVEGVIVLIFYENLKN